MLSPQVRIIVLVAALRSALAGRLEVTNERGEVTSTTILIAVLAGLALAVGVIITTKVTDKANAIPTN